jgi:ParB-like chromosome segregation protein Spo0J
VSGQLTLLPTTAPELRGESLPLDLVDGFANAVPSVKLRELIRDLGLLQPIVVVPSRSGRFRIVEGRRRCKAIAELAEVGEWPAPPQVQALVIAGPQAARREVRSGLTLALHASRSASPASELAAIESILESSGGEDEAAAMAEIAAQTGMSVQTVRRRLRLRSLTAGLRTAFDEARVTASVAEAAARLPEEKQAELERRLQEEGRLTLADVREVARQHTCAATAALPGELFTDHEIAWQAAVRGHLTAALAAVPAEGCAAVKNAITELLAAVEKLDQEVDA